MALQGDRTFVGFGFGPIQAGLFIHEAFHSGAFRRLVVAEVLAETVAALKRASGLFSLNIAHPNRVETATVGPVEAENPNDPAAHPRLVAAVRDASEIATAVPSVDFYRKGGPGSIHRILAEGLARRAEAGGGACVVYTAENNNHAAEILREAVLEEVPQNLREAVDRRVRFLNSMIGKMSAVVTDPAEVRARGLAPLTRGEERAFLVEAFNRILISAVRFPPGDAAGAGFRRGISVFVEKPNLLPFEEAKLYGHNATHAAAAYLAERSGLRRIADLRLQAGTLAFLRKAFIEESGAALLAKHRGIDPLFTPEGYSAYADDLLARMTNPHLGDTVERVGRDVRRKLGWEDRLIGTIRLALGQGIRPRRYAFAAAAALATLDGGLADPSADAAGALRELWGEGVQGPEADRVLAEIEEGRRLLAQWIDAGFSDPERLMR